MRDFINKYPLIVLITVGMICGAAVKITKLLTTDCKVIINTTVDDINQETKDVKNEVEEG